MSNPASPEPARRRRRRSSGPRRPEPEQHHRTSLGIAERLAAADPDNAQYQRDLSISHDKLGDLAVAHGDTTTAEQHFRTSLGVRERLAAADPGNDQYRNDVAYVRQRLVSLTDPDAAS